MTEYEKETGKALPRILEARKKPAQTLFAMTSSTPEEDDYIVPKKEGRAIDRKQKTLDDVVIAERSYLTTLKNIKLVCFLF